MRRDDTRRTLIAYDIPDEQTPRTDCEAALNLW